MPAHAAPVPDERSALIAYLRQQQDAFRCAIYGLTDEQAGRRATASALTVGTLVKHVTGVQENWLRLVEAAPVMPTDGAQMYELIAGREGWAPTPWLTPWRAPEPA